MEKRLLWLVPLVAVLVAFVALLGRRPATDAERENSTEGAALTDLVTVAPASPATMAPPPTPAATPEPPPTPDQPLPVPMEVPLKTNDAPVTFTLFGRIVSEETGDPMPDVKVRLQGREGSAVSDYRGEFVIDEIQSSGMVTLQFFLDSPEDDNLRPWRLHSFQPTLYPEGNGMVADYEFRVPEERVLVVDYRGIIEQIATDDPQYPKFVLEQQGFSSGSWFDVKETVVVVEDGFACVPIDGLGPHRLKITAGPGKVYYSSIVTLESKEKVITVGATE